MNNDKSIINKSYTCPKTTHGSLFDLAIKNASIFGNIKEKLKMQEKMRI